MNCSPLFSSHRRSGGTLQHTIRSTKSSWIPQHKQKKTTSQQNPQPSRHPACISKDSNRSGCSKSSRRCSGRSEWKRRMLFRRLYDWRTSRIWMLTTIIERTTNEQLYSKKQLPSFQRYFMWEISSTLSSNNKFWKFLLYMTIFFYTSLPPVPHALVIWRPIHSQSDHAFLGRNIPGLGSDPLFGKSSRVDWSFCFGIISKIRSEKSCNKEFNSTVFERHH